MTSEQIKKLDKALQELSLLNFEQFCKLTNINKNQAFVCLERMKGKPIRAIVQQSGIPKSTVEQYCKKCPRF